MHCNSVSPLHTRKGESLGHATKLIFVKDVFLEADNGALLKYRSLLDPSSENRIDEALQPYSLTNVDALSENLVTSRKKCPGQGIRISVHLKSHRFHIAFGIPQLLCAAHVEHRMNRLDLMVRGEADLSIFLMTMSAGGEVNNECVL